VPIWLRGSPAKLEWASSSLHCTFPIVVGLVGDREPMVLQRQLPGMGRAMRYIITIADDDRSPLDKLSADIACDVMRNVFGPH
jgi:hypothetical protein